MSEIVAVILAGGSGTRFWPLSRNARPKQFLALATDKSLIHETYARLPPLVDGAHTLVVCGQHHEDGVREHVAELSPANVLVEPAARNTAAAIGYAATEVRRRFGGDAVMLILPSDHHVGEPAKMRESLAHAARLADDGWLVTLGIDPLRPETGYGYILRGEVIGPGAWRAQRFVEKPDADTARGYLADGRYSWNAGIFAFRADRLLEELAAHMPELHEGLEQIALDPASVTHVFPRLPSMSIDYGVMEKAERIAVIPSSFGWSDVGSFAAIPEVRDLDARGNALAGEAMAIDCDGCVVLAGERLVAAVGLKDVVVVDAGDAVLVVHKDRAQDVRKVVDALKARGSPLL